MIQRAEATHAPLLFAWFQKKQCTKCRVFLPLASYYERNGKPMSWCRSCFQSVNAECRRRWEASNPDAAKARNRKRYEQRRESQIKAVCEWRAAHPEKVTEYRRRIYTKHKDSILAWNRNWRKENKDKTVANGRRYYARKKAQSYTVISSEQLEAKLSYWGNCCWMCKGLSNAVDHVKPISKGGAHMLCNLRPICQSCNSSKRSKWPLSKVLEGETLCLH